MAVVTKNDALIQWYLLSIILIVQIIYMLWQDGLYGVYAEVAKFRGWIDETIKDKDTSAIFCN